MKGYIKGLDGLRALGVIIVIVGHFSDFLSWNADSFVEKSFLMLVNASWVGVQLFFVISGYLITKILLNSKGQEFAITNFYIRRCLRIFPIYYLTLAFFFLLLPLIGAEPERLTEAADNQLLFWTHLSNWSNPFINQGPLIHLWSLAIEEQFYLLWPFIVGMLSQRRLAQLCLFMIVSAICIRLVFFYYPELLGLTAKQGSEGAYYFTVARWDAIAFGALLAVIMANKDYAFKVKKSIRPGILLMGTIILIEFGVLRNFAKIGEGMGILNQTIASIGFVLVVGYVLKNSRSIFVRIMEWRVLKSIGKVSYAMYLFHLPLLHLIIDPLNNMMSSISSNYTLLAVFTTNILFLTSVYLISLISWQLFEYPILKLKDRLTIKQNRKKSEEILA